jgi:hypothetical protein
MEVQIADPDFVVLVAEAGDEIVGYAMATRPGTNYERFM